MLKARRTEDSGCSPSFATLLVATLDAGQRFERLVSLGHSGAMRFKETLITAQNRHDRDRLLYRTLEVVTDDVRVALLELLSARGLSREDGQERLVLGLNRAPFYAQDFGAFADPCSDYFFAFAVIVVCGIMIGQHCAPSRIFPIVHTLAESAKKQ